MQRKGNAGSSLSARTNSNQLIYSTLELLQRCKFFKVGTNWGNPYQKPVVKDHNGDLQKQWYVYYRYWDDKKGKLQKARKSEIPGVISPNRVHNVKERYRQMALLRDAIELLLSRGWTPLQAIDLSDISETGNVPIHYAHHSILIAVELKSKEPITDKTKGTYRKVGQSFATYIIDSNKKHLKIEDVERSDILDYLRKLDKKPRTRNNYLNDLKTLFEKLREEQITNYNPCQKIKPLATKVERHKQYTHEQITQIAAIAEKYDPMLKDFIMFVGYTYFRPSEIIHLQVKNVHKGAITAYADHTKRGTTEVAIIIDRLQPLVQRLLSQASSPDDYLFTTKGQPGAHRIHRADYLSRRFKKLKTHYNQHHHPPLNHNHTLYGMRHTFIADLYQAFRQKMTKEQAEYALMPITRHRSLSALRKYIRDYSLELPADYSHFYSLRL